MSRSTCHRLLADLVEGGYVRQLVDHSSYILTMRMTSNGLEFLSLAGIADMAQPIIEPSSMASDSRTSSGPMHRRR